MAADLSRPGLGSAFAGAATERGAGLSSSLKPKAAAAPAPEAAPTPAPVPLQAPPATAAKPARPKTKRVSAAATTSHQVSVYLPEAILAAIKDVRHIERITYDEILIAAFEQVSETRLAEHFMPVVATTSKMPARAKTPTGKAGIQIQIVLTTEQKDWIDEQVRLAGAPNRSSLMAAVLSLYLPDRLAQLKR